MEGVENFPVLYSNKPMKNEFREFERLTITSQSFTIGRGLKNSVIIPCLSISRNHCTLTNTNDNKWVLEDNSSFGVDVNGQKIGKGMTKLLNHGDILSLEPSGEFIYKFTCPLSLEEYETPKKRIKLEPRSPDCNNILNDVKIKFEESQNYEIRHIEDKIQNAKNMQTTSLILKEQLKLEMLRKTKQLEKQFSIQIKNLKGKKKDIETQKAVLLEERDMQLACMKEEMQGKINELMVEIKKHNETETELLKENNLLKEKLMKEREEFLSELNRENTSKQDMLDKLECKIKEQEEFYFKEKRELEENLRKETEQLRLAKEKELKELEEQSQQREIKLKEELNNMKKDLQLQLELNEQQNLQAQEKLNEEMEVMKKLNEIEKVKMEELIREREEYQNKLKDAQENAQKSLQKLQQRVSDRETELAAMAAERIQKQAEQSSEVIYNLQEQLEKVKNQLQCVENEKDSLLKNINTTESAGEGTSKQNTLAEVGELVENELQCSICAELFIEAITLSCSHTFCKYCITKWKNKKKDCPICRTPITSECRSLVLDSFIEKMVQKLTNEMKEKRQEILKNRAEEVIASMNRSSATRSTRGRGRRRTTNGSRVTGTSHTSIMMIRISNGNIPVVDLTTTSVPPHHQSAGGAGGAWRAPPARTTAGTGAASGAGPGATGRRAAPTPDS